MTHLPYVVAAYSLGVLIPGSYGLAAFVRMRAAARRLAAIDPRVNRTRASPRVKRPEAKRPGASR
jgi:hypothetical protein